MAESFCLQKELKSAARSFRFYLPNSCGLRGVYLSRFSSNKARWNKACPRASSVFGSAYFLSLHAVFSPEKILPDLRLSAAAQVQGGLWPEPLDLHKRA